MDTFTAIAVCALPVLAGIAWCGWVVWVSMPPGGGKGAS
jgi:hypothetical protein